jgi:hypothetical protein
MVKKGRGWLGECEEETKKKEKKKKKEGRTEEKKKTHVCTLMQLEQMLWLTTR